MRDDLEVILVPGSVVAGAAPQGPNPAAVYLATLRASGRRTQQIGLNTVAELLGIVRPEDATGPDTRYLAVPWHQVRYIHTQALRAALADRYQPARANAILSALRRVLQEAWRLGLMSAEDYQRAADIPNVVAASDIPGRALVPDEVARLLAVCAADPHPLGARDAALIAILDGAGLRRAEVVGLELRDYDAATGALDVRSGKRGKSRRVYLAPGSQQALDDWLAVRGSVPGPLLRPVHWRGAIQHDRAMNPQTVLYALRRRATQAGVDEAFTPHDLRRTFISELLDAGADIVTVQKLAGHADVKTTARYDRRGEATKRAAAHLRTVPYERTARRMTEEVPPDRGDEGV